MIEAYAEYGAIGVIVSLFGFMIVNLIKSQKSQNQDLDDIRVHIGKMESTVKNVESITITHAMVEKVLFIWAFFIFYLLWH